VEAGAAVALVGESGSGKTTIGRIIVGLEQLTAGTVSFQGRPLDRWSRADRRTWRRDVQMIFQDPYASLDPRYRVFDVVAEGPRANGIRGKGALRETVEAALRLSGLDATDDMMQRYPHELSGGQRQRVAIARAIVLRPRVLVADEPVSMLDISVRAGILRSIELLRQELSLTLIFITHDLAVARYVSETMKVMYLGRIVESAPSDVIITEPLHPYTQLLLAACPDVHDRSKPVPNAPAGRGSLLAPSTGCRFAPRCPLATDLCRSVEPELVEAAPQRFVACHRAGDRADWTGQVATVSGSG
jgi:peptide/nickel transport system ATP-binding protein